MRDLSPDGDDVQEQLGEYRRIAVLGGVYNNCLALEATLDDARARGCEAVFCLGDLGGFGPHPDRVFPLLRERGVLVIQGNYDDSIGHGRADCGCGYTDPRDNHYAQISYDTRSTRTVDREQAVARRAAPAPPRASSAGTAC